MTKINTSFNPMPESIDPLTFKNLYIQVISNKESDPTKFLKYIEPFLLEVERAISLKNESYYFYHFLKKNILSFTTEDAVDRWAQNNTLKEDLLYVLFLRLRKIKTIPKQAKPTMCQFYFVTDYRLAISNYIKKHYTKKQIAKTKKENSIMALEIDANYSDHWCNYLFSMLSLGYTITEISKLTGYSRTTIYKELKKYVSNKKRSD